MPTRKVISAEALINFDDGPTIEYGTKISEDMLDASLIGLELTFEDGAKKSITDLSGIDIANVQADNFTYRVGSEIVAGGEIIDASTSPKQFSATFSGANATFTDEDGNDYTVSVPAKIVNRKIVIEKASPRLEFNHKDFYFKYPAQDCPVVDRTKAAVYIMNTLTGQLEKKTGVASGVSITGTITCGEACSETVSVLTAEFAETNNYKGESVDISVTVKVACADKPLRAFNALVKSFSCTNSFNGDSGSLQMTLVEDPNAIDPDNPDEKLPAMAAFPRIGTPCYFKYNNFYFSGLFQRWTYKESVSGGKTYDVVLSSLSPLLDKVHVILRQFIGNYYGVDVEGGNWNPYFAFMGPHGKYGQLSRRGSTYENRDGFSYTSDNPSITNVINPLAHWENAYVDGQLTLNWMGQAGVNQQGWPIDVLLGTIQPMINTPYAETTYSGGPRLQTNHWGGRIWFGDSEFGIDLREVEEAILNTEGALSYRVDGVHVDMNSLLKQISDLTQYDYYTEILPARDEDVEEGVLPDTASPTLLVKNIYGEFDADGCGPIGLDLDTERSVFSDPLTGEIYGIFDPRRTAIWRRDEHRLISVIKIRMVNRQEQPEPNVIKDFIQDQLGENNVISFDFGGELTNNVTQRVSFGAQATRLWGNAISQATMYPVFGANPGGSDPLSNQPNVRWLDIPVAGLQPGTPVTIDTPLGPYNIKMFEFRMALGGRAAWDTYKQFELMSGTELNGFNINNAPWLGSISLTAQGAQRLANGAPAEDFIPTDQQQAARSHNVQLKTIGEAIFNSVKKAADEFYMQKFLVPLPAEPSHAPTFNNELIRLYNYKRERPWEIADAGWHDNILGFDASFYDNTGKMKSTVVWPYIGVEGDYSELGSDYGFGAGGIASTKANIEKDPFWVNRPEHPQNNAVPGPGNHMAYCDSGGKVLYFDSLTTPDFGITVLCQLFYGISVAPARYMSSNKQQVQVPIHPDVLPPTRFYIPQSSDRYSYGPWYSFSTSDTGPQKLGPAEVIFDPRLAPENYGSVQALDENGRILANVGLAQFAEQESGNLVVHEQPRYRLGERFLAVGPYITDMNVSVSVDGGTIVKYSFNTWTPNFGKLAKFNLDRISLIRQNGIEGLRKSIGVKRPFAKRDFKPIDKESKANRFHNMNSNIVNGQLGNNQPGHPAGNRGGGAGGFGGGGAGGEVPVGNDVPDAPG